MSDNLAHLIFGDIKARAPLYLLQHVGNGVNMSLRLIRLSAPTQKEEQGCRNDNNDYQKKENSQFAHIFEVSFFLG